MTTSNATIEEGSCTIVIFFLLLPVMICIIKDVKRDFLYYMTNGHPTTTQSGFELNLIDDSSSDFERASLLNHKSKDSDDETEDIALSEPPTPLSDDDGGGGGHQSHHQIEHQSPTNLSVTLVDSKRNILAATKSPQSQHTQSDDGGDQLCVNHKIPELILNPIIPEYHQYITIEIKPMELILWLLFLTLSYIALRTMVVTKNMRYNFKYNAVEMQDIFELCLRGK